MAMTYAVSLSRMPADPAIIPTFFDNAERVFKDTDISVTYQAQLLMFYLTDKARAMVGQMNKKSIMLRRSKSVAFA